MQAGSVIALFAAGIEPDLLVGTFVGATNAAQSEGRSFKSSAPPKKMPSSAGDGILGSSPTATEEAGSGLDDNWRSVVDEWFPTAGAALGRAPRFDGT
jgi:hypothetical protein